MCSDDLLFAAQGNLPSTCLPMEQSRRSTGTSSSARGLQATASSKVIHCLRCSEVLAEQHRRACALLGRHFHVMSWQVLPHGLSMLHPE